MAELRDQIAASVRRELDQKRRREKGASRSDDDDQEGRLDEAQAATRTRATERSGEAGQRDPHGSRSTGEDQADGSLEPSAVASPELGRSLQEQIGQALQPAMAEFRDQMAATVRRELDETLQRDRRRAATDTGRTTDRDRAETRPSSDDDADQATDDEGVKGADSSSRHALKSLLGKPFLEALPEMLEQQGEQWLRSRLDLGIDFIFSTWVRAAVQQEVEQTFQRVARAAADLISDRATREDLRTQAEQTVKRLVRTALDKLFEDDVRDDLKARAHQAVGALFQRDLKSILHQAQELLLSLLEGLLAVLRECWEVILRLLGKVVFALFQSRLTATLKDAFSSLATTSKREGEKSRTGPSTAVDDDAESRRVLAEPPAEALRDDARERDDSQPGVREDEGATDSNGERDDRRLGRAQSGRPSTGRPPTSRRPPERSSSDRSVSGRPSRATSR